MFTVDGTSHTHNVDICIHWMNTLIFSVRFDL